MNNLILVGGGGHCKSVIDAAESAGFKIIAILDKEKNIGKKILDYTITGTDDDIPNYINKGNFIVTVGQIKNSLLRMNLYDKILNFGGKLATIIASTAYVSKYAKIDEGTVVLHHALVNAEANVGKGCIINSFTNIEHESIIGDYSHISTGVMINGGCEIGHSVFIGSNSTLFQGISVVSNSTIGAGSLVNKDILEEGTYIGNPILRIK
ncbi:MAG: acetyltransferase [Dysgonomonas sp.]|nr:acetyltransferase [Dysgonomonas sp.]